jgi:hypothetical protein
VEQVFAALLDASLYPRWLVGAVRIRSVDANWPAVGARFQHVIGAGPFRIPGSTTVAELHEPDGLLLSAGMGPLGRAMVRFGLEPCTADGHAVRRGGQAAPSTLVRMHEVAADGPARWGWLLLRPIAVPALFGRNALSLTRLRGLIEAGSLPRAPLGRTGDDVGAGETTPAERSEDGAARS